MKDRCFCRCGNASHTAHNTHTLPGQVNRLVPAWLAVICKWGGLGTCSSKHCPTRTYCTSCKAGQSGETNRIRLARFWALPTYFLSADGTQQHISFANLGPRLADLLSTTLQFKHPASTMLD